MLVRISSAASSVPGSAFALAAKVRHQTVDVHRGCGVFSRNVRNNICMQKDLQVIEVLSAARDDARREYGVHNPSVHRDSACKQTFFERLGPSSDIK